MERQKVLVTGAASGIGRSTAIRFATEGYDVCVNDIQEQKVVEVFEELPGGNHLLLPADYAKDNFLTAGKQLIERNWGRLNALVNCAGMSEKTDPAEMTIDRWRLVFDTMVNGCWQTSRLAVDCMPEGGRIIHISSIHANRAERNSSSYSMAKAAINQYCRSMALEWADKGILVNAIAPGFVNTAMSVTDGENELETKWFRDNYVAGDHLPLRRAAAPEEIAGVAFFLAGKDAAYITGQVIIVDGGLTITF